MLGTYAAALMVIGASLPIGAAVLALAGRREWSWLAPALGLAAVTALAWLFVRLPGEGLAALIGIAVVAIGAGLLAFPRLGLTRASLTEGLPSAALALAAVSVPFVVEGHFGILGTGFNVDMSQHLFTAEWISTQLGPAPSLIDQGYPVGPHSLAVAGAELTGGNLVTAFTGVTIAVPVIGAMTALAGTRHLGPIRATLGAALVAIPYLVASYLAQGAFKELFEAVFLLAFVLWLAELRRSGLDHRGLAVPGAVLAVGSLYAYSGPGLAWLLGTAGLWIVFELLVDRRRALGVARRSGPAMAIALVALVVAVAPEAGRIADFGGSAGNVATAARPAAGPDASLSAQGADSDAETAAGAGEAPPAGETSLDLFDNELGNLFGDVPPLEMLGVWPSGDFRVQPGDGAIPALAFYLGALLGLLALAVGLRRAITRRETALLAGLAAVLVIWLAAWALSTPYTTAKALQMVAPVLMLVSVRGVLDPGFAALRGRGPGLRPLLGPALAGAFLLAASGSSALALANAPVGPERYTAGISKLRDRLTGEPLLLLAPSGQLEERHGAEFYGWELRGGRPICVEAFPDEAESFGRPAPAGIHFVITVGAKDTPPFDDVEEISRRRRVGLWEVEGFDGANAPPIDDDPDVPTSCALGL